MRRTRAACLAAILLLPWVLAASRMELLVVRVVDAARDRPIPNADVLETSSGVHRLTDARGEARFPVASTGPITLRVRQLGYAPAERTIQLGRDRFAAPLTIALSRLVVLATTTSATASPCRGTADSLPSPLSLMALEQLRFGAEQYERFWDQYPFSLSFERRKAYFRADGTPLTVLEGRQTTDQRDWGMAYRPGRVVFAGEYGQDAVPLSIGTLADPAFWEQHCLVARKVVTIDGRRMLPLEFLPSLTVEAPDYGGTAWVDSATRELRRVDFQLIGLSQRTELRRMEGYITFTNPSPYIARPDSMVALWWTRTPLEGQTWGMPSRVTLVRVSAVKYLRDEPPPASAREP